MNSSASDLLDVRRATPDDVPELAWLLNAIIRIGGTTAYETVLGDEDFAGHFVSGTDVLCCFVAAGRAQPLLFGFQTLSRHSGLPGTSGDIATFARTEPHLPGTGSALFERTRREAARLGLEAINATIRADNAAGLAYYSRIGFEDHAVTRGVPLSDGTPVDRISKRYLVR